MTAIRLRLDDRVEPASVRVGEAIRAAIDDGELLPGDRVPTVRSFAADHGLAPNTVAKAYRRLESLGYLTARARTGSFVAAAPPPPTDAQGRALAEAAERFASRAHHLGVGSAEAVDAVRNALADIDP